MGQRRILYLPDRKVVEAEPGETLLEASLRAGLPHVHVCGGKARCSTCRVLVLEGLEHCTPRTPSEEAIARRLRFPPEIRLACQTRVTGPVTVRRLVLDPEDIALTNQLAGAEPGPVGEERELAILFADIRGFTEFAADLPPYDVVHVLNRHFHEMERVLRRHGGHLDSWAGDRLLALFGLEGGTGAGAGVEASEEAALRAVRAGLEMLEIVRRSQVHLQELYGKGFGLGVGVHCGSVVVGRVGAGAQRRVTAIGEAVNLASRIEEATKPLGADLLISQAVHERVKERVQVGRVFQQRLPGVRGEQTLYEVVALKDGSTRGRRKGEE